jgi:hypothetical protein
VLGTGLFGNIIFPEDLRKFFGTILSGQLIRLRTDIYTDKPRGKGKILNR